MCILFKCYLERTLVNGKYMFKTNLICLTLTLRKCKTINHIEKKKSYLASKNQIFFSSQRKPINEHKLCFTNVKVIEVENSNNA